MPASNIVRLEDMRLKFRNTDQYIDFLAKEDTIRKILQLKEEKNVLILGHNYMEPIVYQISGEKERGDSLALSKYAATAQNPIILFDGVRFMAETAKILNPEKKVLIADLEAGCSLADPFKAADVLEYKARYPGAPVVTYINSYAEVKAESDYCCTSANALRVVKHAASESGTKKVVFLPDSFMGENLQKELGKEGSDIDLIYPGKEDNKFGSCIVHEKISADNIRLIRKQFDMPNGSKDSAVLVHWECKPEVLDEAEFYGSTSEMIKYVASHPELKRVYLGTECEMSANLSSEFPEVEFIKSCMVHCPHMRKITLDKILRSLENEVYEVNVPEDVRVRALGAIERMLAI